MSYYEPDLEMYERERIVLETIKNNPDLHHNALIKLIVPEFMAKQPLKRQEIIWLKKKSFQCRAKET